MNQLAGGVLVFVLGMQMTGVSSAAQRGTEEYNKLVEYKKAQREKKATEKTQGAPKEKNFWQREAARSGFAGTAAMFGNAIGGLIPLDKPNSRKDQ